MPLKTIVTINVDDKKFQEWIKQPHAIKVGVDPESIGPGNSRRPGGKSEVEKDRKKQKEFWGSIEKSGKSFAKELEKSTLALAKWTLGAGFVIGGLGVTGAKTVGNLAENVESRRFAARGLGLLSGEQQAFGINYRTMVNPDEFLSNVFEAKKDLEKKSALYNLGFTENQIQENPVDLAKSIIPAIKEFLDREKPENITQQWIGGNLLGKLGLSVQDVERINNTTKQEILTAQSQFEIDRKTLKLSEQQQNEYIKLNQQADRASKQIENAFIVGLKQVAPELDKLSKSLVDAITTITGSNSFKESIDLLSDGIKTFADYLTSQSFKSDMQNFLNFVHSINEITTKTIGFFGGNSIHKQYEELKSQGIIKEEFNEQEWQKQGYSQSDIANEKEAMEKIIVDEYNKNQKKVGIAEAALTIVESSAIGFGEGVSEGIKRNFDLEKYKRGFMQGHLDKIFLNGENKNNYLRPEININNNSSADVSVKMNALGVGVQ